MEPSFLKFNYQARYYSLGKITSQTRKIWIVLHGYGQLASYFIKKFKVLEGKETFILAPEGLSRFYLEGFSGRVGATWMTREDRLTDISNYLEYLNTIYCQEIQGKASDKVEITLLGFSQGCATACRWIVHTEFTIHRLLLWSGVFPPDLNLSLSREKLKDKDIQVIYGTKDPFLEKNPVDILKTSFNDLQINPKITTFEGGHEILKDTLLIFN